MEGRQKDSEREERNRVGKQRLPLEMKDKREKKRRGTRSASLGARTGGGGLGMGRVSLKRQDTQATGQASINYNCNTRSIGFVQ